jgi:hypothetical protein
MRSLQVTLSIAYALILIISASNQALAGNETFLSDTAIAALTEADRKLQLDAVLSVLESTDAKAAKEWQNPQTGSSGRSESVGNFKSDEGLHCRKLRLFTQSRGIDSQFAFPVCKNASGEWFIASGMRLTRA